ncbi:MAG: hypothetical protein C5B54_04140 [Acidobacteria bacterium]|nr:MAG: hypothetical protein C5B54_04140 [Acidobacteriota bacterium]
MLSSERRQIVEALAIFDAGGHITNLTVARETDPPPGTGAFSIMISTVYMDYPQMMVEAIKNFLHQRRDQIAQELTDLGVTNITDEPIFPDARGPALAPAPAAAAAAPESVRARRPRK